MNWIRFSVALGGFVVVALILVAVIICKEFKTVPERLFIYLLVATLLREAVLMSNIEHQFAYQYLDEVCSMLGALNFYTAVLVLIYVTSTIGYLLSRATQYQVVHQRSKAFAKFFEIGFVIFTFLFPLIVSIALLYTDLFGLSMAWCWVREYDVECQKSSTIKKILGGYSGVLSINGDYIL